MNPAELVNGLKIVAEIKNRCKRPDTVDPEAKVGGTEITKFWFDLKIFTI